MSFSLLHKLVAYLLSGLGLVALSLGTEIEETTVALVLVAYAASWFAEGRILGRPAWTTTWTVAVVACLVLQLARAVLAEPTLAMAIEFAAFLQVSRLFNRRSAADYQQVAVLAFLHLIAATVLSTSLDYAAIFFGFVVGTPWMLALSHLRREIEGNYPVPVDDPERTQTAVARVLASRRVVGPSFLVGIAALALPLFAMTLGIFLVIPRVGKGFLSFQRGPGERVAGFGNQVELGDFGVIRDDPTVVLRVTLDPSTHERPPALGLYLRGTSFDHYDGRRWSRSPSTAHVLGRIGMDTYPLRRLPDMEKDHRLRIVLDHLSEPVVFLPTRSVALSIPPRIENAARIPRNVTHSSGFDVRYEDPDALGLIYTAYVSVDANERDILPIRPERRLNYLQLPSGHTRVATLARQVVGDAVSEFDKASRIERFLHSSAYHYTLEQPDVGDAAPLEAFLFDAKRGHCEYFSSAMAIMLRTLGVATRNVTGFAGGRYNPYGDYYAVRQGDAHSWVEVYVPERGWVTFDPTPPARGDMGPREGAWADLSALIDALRTRWLTNVVGYDLKVQTSALRKMWEWWVAQRQAQRDTETRTGDAGERWVPSLPSTNWLLGVVAFAALGWLLVRLSGRERAKSRPLPEHVAQAIKLYTDLEHILAKRGHARPASSTPFEHARTLAEQGFAATHEVEEITRGYVEARYGNHVLSAHEIAKLRADLSRVRAAPP